MITSVVAAKIWYLKNVQFLLGHPVLLLIEVANYQLFSTVLVNGWMDE